MRQEKLQPRNYYQQFTSQNFQTKQQYYNQSTLETRNQFYQKQARQVPKAAKYSINNLPIIYDNSRTATPKRNSRIVYASKQDYQRERSPENINYQTVQFNNGRQELIRPVQLPKKLIQQDYAARIQQNSNPPFLIKNPSNLGQISNLTGRKIIGNVADRGSEFIDHRVQASYEHDFKMPPSRQPPKFIKQEQNQKQTSRMLIQKNISKMPSQSFHPQALQLIHVPPQNLPPGLGERPVSSYITSQIQLEPISGAQMELKSYNVSNRPQNVSYLNQPHQQIIPQNQKFIGSTQFNSKSNLSTSVRQIPPSVLNQINLQNAMHRQSLQQNNPQIISNRLVPGLLSSETVPKIQFDKCITECKNWQTKYNELYLKYMSLAAAGIQSNSTQIQGLRQQNYRLKRQLKEQRQKNAQVIPILTSKFTQMVSNQRQATIRECNLLLERYRLEAKHNKF